MNIHKAANCLAILMAANIPVMLWSAPGIGKSSMTHAVARAFKYETIDFRLNQKESVDLRGLPRIKSDSEFTSWAMPDDLPFEDSPQYGEKGILFFDEINTALPSIQAAVFGPIQERRVGRHNFKPGWRIVAAGNRQSDRAAAQRMPSALANRFGHIDIEADSEIFCDFAINGAEIVIRPDCLAFVPMDHIAPEIIAFIRFRPTLLHKMDGADLRSFPSPRSWEMLSKIIHCPADLLPELAAGIIGQEAANEFIAFLSMWKELPSLADIFANPETCKVPSELSARFAIAAAIGRAVTHANIGAAVTYMARVSPSFSTMAIMDAVKRDVTLKETAAFVQWAIANSVNTL